MNRCATLSAILALGIAAPAFADSAFANPAFEQGGAPAQARLEREVRHELTMLPYYGVFDHLAFQVEGFKVALLGEVTRPALKSDAEAAVKRIEGVEALDNQIEVLPLSPNDDRIRRAVYRAIYRDTVLSRYALQAIPPIHILVKNGRVRLEGVVTSEADRNIAGIRAGAVGGVFSIENKLLVEQRPS